MSDTVILDGELSLTNQLDGQGGVYSRYDWRGYSAYEIAVQHGYTGTEEEWLASLHGADGATGPQGETGATGPQGPKGDKGDPGDDYVLTEQDKQEIAGMVDTPVDDVQINGTSILQDGVANVPIATMPTSGTNAGNLGLTCFKRGRGIAINGNDNSMFIDYPTLAQVKAGNDTFKPVTTLQQHASAFYGLAKAAGDTTQSQSSNAVGAYTEEAKTAIRTMLGLDTASLVAEIREALGI